ncbi:MAG: hypothetical protein ACK4N1_09925, partial [Pseudorhizobium sp.]
MEARILKTGLQRAEWTFRGGRNRVFLLKSGSGTLRLGSRDISLRGPALVWIPLGEAGTTVLDAGTEGGMLAIPDIVLGPAMPSGGVFAYVREAIARPVLGAGLSPADVQRHFVNISTIEQELQADLPGAQEVIRHHLALLLLAIWRNSEPSAPETQPSPRAIVRSFLHLVELHAREHWTIPRYAATLGITTD